MRIPLDVTIKTGILATVLSCAAMFAGCSRPLPEQALRRSVASLQSAVESRDASALEDALARDFVGHDGLDRDGARRIAALLFMRNADIHLVLGPLDVALQDSHATVRCTAAISGGSGGVLPDSGQIYDVVSGWRLEDGEWRVTSLQWTPR